MDFSTFNFVQLSHAHPCNFALLEAIELCLKNGIDQQACQKEGSEFWVNYIRKT